MKNSILLIALLLSFAALNHSCSETAHSNPNAKEANIPELLDRSEKIQLGTEWDYVQNVYGKQKQAINQNSDNNEAKLKLAELFVREARVTGEHGHYYPAALSVTEQVMKSESASNDVRFQAMVTRAGVQLSLHEFSTALETALQAYAINQTNAQIHGVLVDCYVELGDYDKAVKMADKMVNIKPDIRSYSRVSYMREIHGDVDGAKQAMQLAVKAGYPGYEETAWAMLTLGEMYLQYGDLDAAENIFKQILETREDYPFAVANLGEIAYQKGEFEKAEKLINEAINIIPEVGYYVQLAHLYKDQNRKEELNKIMDEIFAMLADDEAAGHNMNLEYADIYLEILENNEKAFEYAMIEFNKRPENIDVNRLLAKIYLDKGDKQKAKQCLAAATITNSAHPEIAELQAQI